MLSNRNKAMIYAYNRGYRANKQGDIISFTGKKIKLCANTDGYFRFAVRHNGKSFGIMAHRLVAYCKYKEKLFEAQCVRHLDGNPANNFWDNVVLGSQSDNMMDVPREQRLAHSKLAVAKLRKLTDEQVVELRYNREEGFSYTQLMLRYGIAKSTVSFIVNRKTYVNI